MAPNEGIEIKATGSVHLSLQGKGGVGKSLVASILAQYLNARPRLSAASTRTRSTKHQIVELIEFDAHARPSPIELEITYQASVAMDRIRFAIRQTEQFGPHTDQMREAGIRLLEALSADKQGGQ